MADYRNFVSPGELTQGTRIPHFKIPSGVTAERLAQLFHDNYERLAPAFGYKTREDSAVPWSEVPDKNRKLMIATAEAVLKEIQVAPYAPVIGQAYFNMEDERVYVWDGNIWQLQDTDSEQ